MKKTWKDYLFVGLQFLLFGLYAFEFLPIYKFHIIIRYFGLLVAIVGICVMVLSLVQLRKNLTAFPTPTIDAELITSGMYKFSRHPIYTGIILFLFGYGFFQNSISKLILVSMLLLLFYFKTNYEENQLLQKFRDYEGYRKNVNRFFPKIEKTKK